MIRPVALTSFDFGVGLAQFSRVDGHAISARTWHGTGAGECPPGYGISSGQAASQAAAGYGVEASGAGGLGGGQRVGRSGRAHHAQRLSLGEEGARCRSSPRLQVPYLAFIEAPLPLRPAGPWTSDGSLMMT